MKRIFHKRIFYLDSGKENNHRRLNPASTVLVVVIHKALHEVLRLQLTKYVGGICLDWKVLYPLLNEEVLP